MPNSLLQLLQEASEALASLDQEALELLAESVEGNTLLTRISPAEQSRVMRQMWVFDRLLHETSASIRLLQRLHAPSGEDILCAKRKA